MRVNQQMTDSHELQFTPSVVFELPLEADEIAGGAALSQERKWIDARTDKSAVLVSSRVVKIVDHGPRHAAENQQSGEQADTQVQPRQDGKTDAAKTSESKTVAITMGHEVACLAFSNCGNYLAIADDSGTLHLFKNSGEFLFAYPVISTEADDR